MVCGIVCVLRIRACAFIAVAAFSVYVVVMVWVCACGGGSREYIECAIILRVKTGDKGNSSDASIIEASL